MAVITWLDINVQDAQKRKATLSFRIKPIAFATGQALPSAAKIDAVIDSIFNTADSPSDAKVLSYAVRVEETAPLSTGGAGGAALSFTARVRNSVDAIPGNWLFHIPGLLKSRVSWSPTDPNSIGTTGVDWDAIRDALTDADIAVSDPEGAYTAVPADEIAEFATGVDGRRSPMRPR